GACARALPLSVDVAAPTASDAAVATAKTTRANMPAPASGSRAFTRKAAFRRSAARSLAPPSSVAAGSGASRGGGRSRARLVCRRRCAALGGRPAGRTARARHRRSGHRPSGACELYDLLADPQELRSEEHTSELQSRRDLV